MRNFKRGIATRKSILINLPQSTRLWKAGECPPINNFLTIRRALARPYTEENEEVLPKTPRSSKLSEGQRSSAVKKQKLNSLSIAITVLVTVIGLSITTCKDNSSGYRNAYEFKVINNGTGIEIGKFYIGDSTEIVIPSQINGLPVTSIGNGAFSNFTSLTSIVIPNSVISIGVEAFRGCYSLISVSLPSVTSIGNRAFFFCVSLTSVSSPAVTSIGYSAFWSCRNLTSVSFPAAISIGSAAFSAFYDYITKTYISNLTSVSFPAVTSIDNYAFEGCTNLESVTLGGRITSSSFSNSSFTGNLRDVYFAAGGGEGTYVRTPPSEVWTKQ